MDRALGFSKKNVTFVMFWLGALSNKGGRLKRRTLNISTEASVPREDHKTPLTAATAA